MLAFSMPLPTPNAMITMVTAMPATCQPVFPEAVAPNWALKASRPSRADKEPVIGFHFEGEVPDPDTMGQRIGEKIGQEMRTGRRLAGSGAEDSSRDGFPAAVCSSFVSTALRSFIWADTSRMD